MTESLGSADQNTAEEGMQLYSVLSDCRLFGREPEIKRECPSLRPGNRPWRDWSSVCSTGNKLLTRKSDQGVGGGEFGEGTHLLTLPRFRIAELCRHDLGYDGGRFNARPGV